MHVSLPQRSDLGDFSEVLDLVFQARRLCSRVPLGSSSGSPSSPSSSGAESQEADEAEQLTSKLFPASVSPGGDGDVNFVDTDSQVSGRADSQTSLSSQLLAAFQQQPSAHDSQTQSPRSLRSLLQHSVKARGGIVGPLAESLLPEVTEGVGEATLDVLSNPIGGGMFAALSPLLFERLNHTTSYQTSRALIATLSVVLDEQVSAMVRGSRILLFFSVLLLFPPSIPSPH